MKKRFLALLLVLAALLSACGAPVAEEPQTEEIVEQLMTELSVGETRAKEYLKKAEL